MLLLKTLLFLSCSSSVCSFNQPYSFYNRPSLFESFNSKNQFDIPELNFNRSAIDEYIQSVLDCKKSEIGAISLSIVQLDLNDAIKNSTATAYGDTILTDPNSPKADENSRFCIGSITKEFTSQIIGKILTANNKTFDTPLKDLLPHSYSFYNSDTDLAEKLTIRDLLAHRHAIPRHDIPWLVGMSKSREEIWKNLYYLSPIKGGLAKSWRSSFEYNNWMVSLAAYAATQLHDPKGNTTWEDLIREFLFEPLKLDSAVFIHDDHKWKNFAIPANRFINGSGWYSQNLHYVQKATETVAPAGAICLSAKDMVKYIQHLTRTSESAKGTPTREILYETFSPSNYLSSVFKLKDPKFNLTEDVYGFGWAVYNYNGARIIGHGGSIFGYLSSLFILPDFKTGVYLSSSNDPWYSDGYVEILALGIVDILMGKSVSPQFSVNLICSASLPPLTFNKTDSLNCSLVYDEALESLLGVYKNPAFDDLIIDFNHNSSQLRMYFGSQGTTTLCQVNKRVFKVKIDSNSSLAVLNNDGSWDSLDSYVEIDDDDEKMIVYAHILEPRASIPPTFVKYFLDTTKTSPTITSQSFGSTSLSPHSNRASSTLAVVLISIHLGFFLFPGGVNSR